MSAGATRLRGLSVRKKLLLLSSAPVFVTGGLLLALFLWGNERNSRAYEDAVAWERHAMALQNLDWAARLYFDSVADRISQDPLPHGPESREALARARAEALWLSGRFSLAGVFSSSGFPPGTAAPTRRPPRAARRSRSSSCAGWRLPTSAGQSPSWPRAASRSTGSSATGSASRMRRARSRCSRAGPG